MASASSVNTSKIFGTKANTVFIDDDWDTWSPKEAAPAPIEYLEYNTPPLALVIAMQQAGKESYDIYNTLQGVGKSKINTENVVTIEHQKLAAEIYDYFAKKHTMRRIKGEYVSEYMLALDDLIESRKRIDKTKVNILVSLPRIYEQNRALEHVMKGRLSAPKPNDLHFPAMKGVIEFVDKVELKKEVHYFFITATNYLMRIVVKKGEYGETAWNVLSKAGKLKIDSPYTYTYTVKGYDFNVIQPSPEMEIKIL